MPIAGTGSALVPEFLYDGQTDVDVDVDMWVTLCRNYKEIQLRSRCGRKIV
jgi:hypothetical protein